MYLVDKSVLANQHRRTVNSALVSFSGQLARCSTLDLELYHFARSAAHYRQMHQQLDDYTNLETDQNTLDLALDLQRRLVEIGHHRNGPSVPDLILAATAIDHGVGLLHYDKDFDTIRRVEPALRSHWIVPRGTAR